MGLAAVMAGGLAGAVGRRAGAAGVRRRSGAVRVPAGADAILDGAGGAGYRLRVSRGWGRAARCWFSALAEPALLSGAGRAGAADGQPLAERDVCRTVRGALARARLRRWRWSRWRLLIVLLAENARIPFDDPNTHLELTMIHEVMVLDHSGPDSGVHPVRRRAQALGAGRAGGEHARAGGRRIRVGECGGDAGGAVGSGGTCGCCRLGDGAAPSVGGTATAGGGRCACRCGADAGREVGPWRWISYWCW